MKIFLVSLIAVFSIGFVSAQSNSDTSLQNRIDVYMRLNRELKFDELMDYTHPKIFELVPRNQLVEVFKGAFNNPDFQMTLDSTFILEVSEPFVFDKTNYKKITYRMVAGLKFKDSSLVTEDEDIDEIKKNLERGFPGGMIAFNKATGWFNINTTTIMFAIKEPAKPWMFLGYEQNSPQLLKLYPPEVIAHFKL